MKAVQVDERTETLYIGDFPDPEMKEDELLVDIKATALNRGDIMQKRGMYPPPAGATPVIGLEMAGVVRETGSNAGKWKKGDRVFALLPGGGYAEKVTVPADMAMKIPEQMSFEEAAAIPEAFLTAYLKLVILGEAKKKESVLIHAGASGVGTAAIQLAKKIGCTVFVTAGTKEKLDFCRSLGADFLINYKKEDFQEVVKGKTDGHGADVILDFIGAPNATSNLETVAQDGRWILIGLLGGKMAEINMGKLLAKRVSLIASTLRGRPVPFKIDLVRQFEQFARSSFEDGSLKPVIDSVYDWKNVNEAHNYMEENRNTGKIVLSVSKS